jgi:hypothetical protein
MLRLEVALISEKQNENTDAQERGAERFAHMSQCRSVSIGDLVAIIAALETGIEAEELCNSDTYTRKRKGRS